MPRPSPSPPPPAHADLQVRRAPRIAILATGDELVEPGTRPGPGQIVSSNSYGLAALVKRFGGEARLLGIAGDTLEDLQAKLALAADADMLVTIGGASVGDRDLVKPALEARGMALDFWKVAVRPGKPMLFGRLDAQRVLGPAGQPAVLPHRRAPLPGAADLPPARAQRRTAARAIGACWRIHWKPTARASTTCAPRCRPAPRGLPPVTALTTQDSSHMSALAAADVLIVRPPDAPAAEIGEAVRVLPLDF